MAERKKYNFENAAKILATKTLTDPVIPVKETGESDQDKNREKAETVVQAKIRQIENERGEKAFNFHLIPREKLVFNKDNEYPMEMIEQLADTILRFGLIHNLEVLYADETDSYVIESGERRTRALDYLIAKFGDGGESAGTDAAEYKMYLKNVKQYADEGYPCNVKKNIVGNDEISDVEQIRAKIESKIRLRIANEEVRREDPVRTQNAVKELHTLYTQLNALSSGRDRINVNEKVAQEFGVSARQIKTYMSIDKLIPELRQLFEQNSITLKDSANYAKLSETEQREIVALIQNGGDKQELKLLTDQLVVAQKQIKQREAEISTLEKAQNEVLAVKLQQEEKIRQLKEEIENNAKSTTGHQAELEATRERLANAEGELRKYEQLVKKIEKEKEEERAKLAEQTRKKMDPAPGMRTALQVENLLQMIAGVTAQFKEILDKYKAVYEESEGEEITAPEEYREKYRQVTNL